MRTTIRRGLTAAVVALCVLTLGPQGSSQAEGPADTTVSVIALGRMDVALNAADTGTASDSFTEAKRLCAEKVLPVAFGSSIERMKSFVWPACPVYVQMCAMDALSNAETAVVHVYADDSWACGA